MQAAASFLDVEWHSYHGFLTHPLMPLYPFLASVEESRGSIVKRMQMLLDERSKLLLFFAESQGTSVEVFFALFRDFLSDLEVRMRLWQPADIRCYIIHGKHQGAWHAMITLRSSPASHLDVPHAQ